MTTPTIGLPPAPTSGPPRLLRWPGRFFVTRPRDGPIDSSGSSESWFDFPNVPRCLPWSGRLSPSWGPPWLSISPLPLRRLRRAMDRFGRGDLRARVGSRRRDEVGEVSPRFDLLAERVETLVTAERRLLQDVSHELRSPLTRLDVAVGLAIKREDRGPLLDRIRRDVTRLSALVGELLHLTRAEGDPSARVLEVGPAGDLLGSSSRTAPSRPRRRAAAWNCGRSAPTRSGATRNCCAGRSRT